MTAEEFDKLTEDKGFVEIAPGEYAKRNRNNPKIQTPKPQHDKKDALEGTIEGENACVGRVKLCFTIYRKQPLDPDNIYGKDIIDGLRASKLIVNDTPWDIALEYKQIKVSTKAREKTVIRLTYP